MGIRTEHLVTTITAAMTTQGVSQVELSDSTGIPRATLIRRLKGHSSFSVDELDLVCDRLGLNPAELLAGAAA